MPAKLIRCVRKVKAKRKAEGKDPDAAWPICVKSTGEKPEPKKKKRKKKRGKR
jgi:hypothetical protein